MFDLKKILVPVDFSERSAAVAPYAKAFAEQFQSQLLLLHVEHNPGFLGSIAAHDHRGGGVLEISQAEAQLKTLSSTEFYGFSASHHVMEGDPAAKIIECARATQADLIMMPTRGCGPYRRLVLGSVTAKVLHDSDWPVWTSAHIENAFPTDPFCRKIACAIDLGPHTKNVVFWASGIASKTGARLLVLHAVPPSDPFIQDASDPEAGLPEMQNAREAVERLLRGMNVKAEIVVDSGSVSEVVYRNVAEFAADLLVMGRHAATGIAGRLHPHAYSIIRESPCPVVSV
ncbi:MAG TPA: universal stress protein [Bryobacteraceae bacterium]|nr:universal stress protein [Bryobacteraceae bacterium]